MITQYITEEKVKVFEEAGWNVQLMTGHHGARGRYIATRSEPEPERGKIEETEVEH